MQGVHFIFEEIIAAWLKLERKSNQGKLVFALTFSYTVFNSGEATADNCRFA